jgi:hypothetical protein
MYDFDQSVGIEFAPAVLICRPIARYDVSFNHGFRLSQLTMFPAFSPMKHLKSLPKIERRS